MRPTILFVEDRATMRDIYSREFQEAGARVLSATNTEDAYRMFRRQSAEISALVTDIRLVNESEFDLSGVELARRIAVAEPDLPLYGLTAFEPKVGEGVLHRVLRKTVRDSDDPDSIYKHVAGIVEEARRFDEGRFGGIPEELLGLKHKYRIASADFERLVSSWRVGDLGRLALLAWHDSQAQPADDAGEANASRTIRFVPHGTPVADGQRLRGDLAVVTRESDDGVVAELYGMPLVYGYGDTPTEAVQALLEHLLDCRRTIGDPEEFAGASVLDVVRFRSFLSRMFEVAREGDR